MGRFHVTKKGRTEPCGASVRACPLGESNHFDSMEEAVQATTRRAMGLDSLYATQARDLAMKENHYYAAAQSERIAVPVAHRRINSSEEIYFSEAGRESGGGVKVTRLKNGESFVRLPILHEYADGQWENVTLKVKPGTSVRATYEKFLDGVEYLPPSSYRIVGTDKQETVVTTLHADAYARLRAALRAADDNLRGPAPTPAPAPKNDDLLKVLQEVGS